MNDSCCFVSWDNVWFGFDFKQRVSGCTPYTYDVYIYSAPDERAVT